MIKEDTWDWTLASLCTCTHKQTHTHTPHTPSHSLTCFIKIWKVSEVDISKCIDTGNDECIYTRKRLFLKIFPGDGEDEPHEKEIEHEWKQKKCRRLLTPYLVNLVERNFLSEEKLELNLLSLWLYLHILWICEFLSFIQQYAILFSLLKHWMGFKILFWLVYMMVTCNIIIL